MKLNRIFFVLNVILLLMSPLGVMSQEDPLETRLQQIRASVDEQDYETSLSLLLSQYCYYKKEQNALNIENERLDKVTKELEYLFEKVELEKISANELKEIRKDRDSLLMIYNRLIERSLVDVPIEKRIEHDFNQLSQKDFFRLEAPNFDTNYEGFDTRIKINQQLIEDRDYQSGIMNLMREFEDYDCSKLLQDSVEKVIEEDEVAKKINTINTLLRYASRKIEREKKNSK